MEKIKNIMAVCIVILFLPYVITILMNGKTESAGKIDMLTEQTVQVRQAGETILVDLDEYIIGILAHQMQASYDIEALKAHAVIVRTNLYHEMGDNELDGYVFEQEYLNRQELENVWGHNNFAEYYDKLAEAVRETEGEVLRYEEQVIDAPYHAVSSGITRKGEEIFGEDEYPYLQPADCPKDVEAEEYLGLTVFTIDALRTACSGLDEEVDTEAEDFGRNITIEEWDSVGYVLKVKIGEVSVPGEEFRQVLGLGSSSFTIQEYHDDLRITTKGLGHGLGLSQFTAHKMAKDGKNYKEILSYFYQNTEIAVG